MKNKTRDLKKLKSVLFILSIAFVFVIVTLSVIAFAYFKKNIAIEADVSQYYLSCGENITEFYYYERDNNGNMIENSTLKLNGTEIYSTEKRLYAAYETIPQNLIDAFVAVEDKRFYDHNGIDWYRTLGAAANYIFKFKDKFGASTITQQLVKNVTGNDSYSVKRKLQEIFYAHSLEKQLKKKGYIGALLKHCKSLKGLFGCSYCGINLFFKGSVGA